MAGELEMSDVRPWRERYGVAAIIESIEATGYDEIDWERGFTLLHLAAMHGDRDLCVWLIERGASISAKDDKRAPQPIR